MTKFAETPDGIAFIARADRLRTSPEIMRAIATVADDLEHARMLWTTYGGRHHGIARCIWGLVTNEGKRPSHDFVWGAAQDDWWRYCP